MISKLIDWTARTLFGVLPGYDVRLKEGQIPAVEPTWYPPPPARGEVGRPAPAVDPFVALAAMSPNVSALPWIDGAHQPPEAWAEHVMRHADALRKAAQEGGSRG